MENNNNYCQQISSFKAKMHQIRFWLRLRPRPSWGNSQRTLRPHSCISGVLVLTKKGENRERARKKRKTGGTKGKRKKGKRTMSQYTFWLCHWKQDIWANAYEMRDSL